MFHYSYYIDTFYKLNRTALFQMAACYDIIEYQQITVFHSHISRKQLSVEKCTCIHKAVMSGITQEEKKIFRSEAKVVLIRKNSVQNHLQ